MIPKQESIPAQLLNKVKKHHTSRGKNTLIGCYIYEGMLLSRQTDKHHEEVHLDRPPERRHPGMGVAAGGANNDTETPTCLPAPDTQMQ